MSVEFLSYFNEVGCTNVPDISWVTTTSNWQSVSGGASAFEPGFNWIQWIKDHSENDYYNLIYIDDNNYIRIVKRSGLYQYRVDYCYNGTIIGGTSSAINADQNLGYFAFGIDDDNQIGYMSFITQRSSSATTMFATLTVYNGSTGGHQTDFYNLIKMAIPLAIFFGKGGGATHIAKRTGTLAAIGASNISDILLVSGGGGGGLVYSGTAYDGKDAGGISGSGDNSANQSTGYGFGQGESGSNVPGGGGGLYGGYKGVTG